MSYYTNFWGHFTITPSLDSTAFAELRARLGADWSKPAALEDRSRPIYACHWEPAASGARLCWDGTENFRDYDVWLRHLIEHFFAPRGYTLDGDVRYSGEETDDEGVLRITRNRVTLEPITPAY
jgi:hypothetical protein